MNINEVIKYPILSEKTYKQMAEGVYTFAVDPRTNRAEVKKVVEYIFDVKVDRVNIINVDKKPKKMGKFQGFTNKVKKAVVYLAEGVINIFPDESAPVEEVKETKEETSKEVKEISAAEKKAAEKIAAKAAEKEAKVETPATTEESKKAE